MSRETCFAAADRTPESELRRQARALSGSALVARLYETVHDAVMILNRERQIVFYNRNCVPLLADRDAGALGRRPGEALGCVHADDGHSGCGTTEFCRTCGAVRAILDSVEGDRASVEECTLRRDGEDVDLLVRATPLTVEGEPFTVFAVRDIGHEKRRRVLERVFFHDLGNTVLGLKLIATRANGDGPSSDALRGAIDHLAEELAAQRDLLAAESGDLRVKPSPVATGELLETLVALYSRARPNREGAVRLDPRSDDLTLTTDRRLLTRVLTNMIRNGLDACSPEEVVTVRCEASGPGAAFHVHNPGCMPAEVQLQLFKRSFSTKGRNRGLGTYSMRLLTERYLAGRVSFTSSEARGTTFTAECPTLA